MPRPLPCQGLQHTLSSPSSSSKETGAIKPLLAAGTCALLESGTLQLRAEEQAPSLRQTNLSGLKSDAGVLAGIGG